MLKKDWWIIPLSGFVLFSLVYMAKSQTWTEEGSAPASWTEEGGSTQEMSRTMKEAVTFISSITFPTGANTITGAGTGTGLDSDKLDGQHGVYYATINSTNNSTDIQVFRSSMSSIDSNKLNKTVFFASMTLIEQQYARVTSTNNMTDIQVFKSSMSNIETQRLLNTTFLSSMTNVDNNKYDKSVALSSFSNVETQRVLYTVFYGSMTNIEQQYAKVTSTNNSTDIQVFRSSMSNIDTNKADYNALSSTGVAVKFITENTTVGYYGRFASSNSVGTPAGGGGGGSGLTSVVVWDKIPASAFSLTPNTVVTLPQITYAQTPTGLVISTVSLGYFVKHPESATKDNYGNFTSVIPNNRSQSTNINLNVPICSSGSANGLYFLTVLLSTCPEANIWTRLDSTTTVPSNANGYNWSLTYATFTWTTPSLPAGAVLHGRTFRDSVGDSSLQDLFIKMIEIGMTITGL